MTFYGPGPKGIVLSRLEKLKDSEIPALKRLMYVYGSSLLRGFYDSNVRKRHAILSLFSYRNQYLENR